MTRLAPMICSFCAKAIARPEPGAPKLAVAGPGVFICRDCVGLCMSSMAESDPQWRDEKIAHLAGFATGESQKQMKDKRVEMTRRLAAAEDAGMPAEPDAAPMDQESPSKS
jgi:hypothetical protein